MKMTSFKKDTSMRNVRIVQMHDKQKDNLK